MLTAGISALESNITGSPQFLFRFIIPILLVFVVSFSYSRLSKKAYIDAPPTLAQMKEPFDLPADRFNKEVKIIQSNNYEKYLTDMGSDFEVLMQNSQDFKRLLKAYRRYDAMSKSTYKKRKKRGEELKLVTFRRILDLYASVRKMKMDHFELASVKEGIDTK
ncbi:MAG: hypothetical protein B2I17_07770 [Thermoplasmatales archaeon B_DKE]|nr:MAG: hypothetical protein B2I17_07770 [Thermoplasmatales archaeon B_DKE]